MASTSTGAGGAAGGGGGGETSSVINCHCSMVRGNIKGITTSAVTRSTWNSTELITDGFRYLSFSGNVAGRSLNRIGFDISASHDHCCPFDKLPAAYGLPHQIHCA